MCDGLKLSYLSYDVCGYKANPIILKVFWAKLWCGLKHLALKHVLIHQATQAKFISILVSHISTVQYTPQKKNIFFKLLNALSPPYILYTTVFLVLPFHSPAVPVRMYKVKEESLSFLHPILESLFSCLMWHSLTCAYCDGLPWGCPLMGLHLTASSLFFIFFSAASTTLSLFWGHSFFRRGSCFSQQGCGAWECWGIVWFQRFQTGRRRAMWHNRRGHLQS